MKSGLPWKWLQTYTHTHTHKHTDLPEYVNPGMQSIVEGNDFVLDLNLTANPIPGDYQWQKDGVDITSGGRFTLTVDQIVIGTTQRNDAGGYTLTAMNIVGQATTSFELDVLCELIHSVLAVH